MNGAAAAGCVLNALRYNGVTQQSYLIQNPDFFPNIPSALTLAAARQPETLQLLSSGLRAPRTYQANIGIERQINSHARISANYISTRGVHLLNTRDITAPVDGIYPFGDSQIRMLTESAGLMRMNQLIVSPNINYKGLFLFGFYNLSYGKDDNEGQPANPYNLRAEWGPSTFADVRHRGVIGTNIPLLWKLNVSPFVVAQSGAPFNITTGLDPFGTGIPSARPALLSNVSAAACTGGNLKYEAAFGCFDLAPSAGQSVIERNYGRGPAMVNVNLRVSRTWSFGRRWESGPGKSVPRWRPAPARKPWGSSTSGWTGRTRWTRRWPRRTGWRRSSARPVRRRRQRSEIQSDPVCYGEQRHQSCQLRSAQRRSLVTVLWRVPLARGQLRPHRRFQRI